MVTPAPLLSCALPLCPWILLSPALCQQGSKDSWYPGILSCFFVLLNISTLFLWGSRGLQVSIPEVWSGICMQKLVGKIIKCMLKVCKRKQKEEEKQCEQVCASFLCAITTKFIAVNLSAKLNEELASLPLYSLPWLPLQLSSLILTDWIFKKKIPHTGVNESLDRCG